LTRRIQYPLFHVGRRSVHQLVQPLQRGEIGPMEQMEEAVVSLLIMAARSVAWRAGADKSVAASIRFS
jgi:hypothetical protein